MLHIVCNRYFLSDRILDRIRSREDIRIIYAEPSAHSASALWKWLVLAEAVTPFNLVSRRYYPRSFYAALGGIDRQDKVLLFDVWGMVDFICTVKNLPTRDAKLWLWNPLSMMGRGELRRKLFARLLRRYVREVSTFDRGDAARYGFRLREQVYYRADDNTPDGGGADSRTPLLFFAGKDKGRLPALKSIAQEAVRAGVGTDFHILPDRHREYTPEDRVLLTAERLEYDDTLAHIRRAGALVELLQKGQQGCTVRALEALFFQKKLITDNKAVTEEAFYHPDNIYLIADDGSVPDGRSLKAFLETPFRPVPEETVSRHDIEHWIGNFL